MPNCKGVLLVHDFSYSSDIVATVLLVSVLKKNPYAEHFYPLAPIFSNHVYLVSELPSIPACYYAIPSVARECEETLFEAKKELLAWGKKLGLSSEHCLLVFGGSGFMKKRLQRRLERVLKRPVRLLRNEWGHEEARALPTQNLSVKGTIDHYKFDFNLSEDVFSIPKGVVDANIRKNIA
jgi:hypothetical protein